MEEDEGVVIADRVEDHFQMMDVICQKVDVEHIPAEDTTQKIEVDTMGQEAEEGWDVEDMLPKIGQVLHPTHPKTTRIDIPQKTVILVFEDLLLEGFMPVMIVEIYILEVMFLGQVRGKHQTIQDTLKVDHKETFHQQVVQRSMVIPQNLLLLLSSR